MDKAVFHLYWKEERAEIFLDTSGETSPNTATEKFQGKHPCWSFDKWHVDGHQVGSSIPFVNPMCGSSTVAIEAVMLATNRRQALPKNYSFMHVVGFDEKFYQLEAEKLRKQIIEVPNLKVMASDIDQDAIDISK